MKKNKLKKLLFNLGWSIILLVFGLSSTAQAAVINGGNYAGADLIPADGDFLNGTFTNVGKFHIKSGFTVYITQGSPFSVSATCVLIEGILDGKGKGYLGGALGSSSSNGFPGAGSGGGQEGQFGACVHGAGGGGGAHGGNGGNASWSNIGGTYMGDGGTANGISAFPGINMGSGGASGASHCSGQGTSGSGGNGGASIEIIATGRILVSGSILANGDDGIDGQASSYGGTGGGGGAGGGINITAASGFITGTLNANGGQGGDAGAGGPYTQAGGGGSGGRIKIFSSLCIDGGSINVNGGNGGCCAQNTARPADAGLAGTIVGGTICGTTPISANSVCEIPASLDFDGTNDYVSIPPFNFSAGNSMTIEAWIKPNNITSNTYYTITRQDNANNPDWLLAFQDNGTILSFGLRTTNGYNELDVAITASNYTDGNWHHIAAVYNGTNKYLYVDGVQIGTATETGNITNNSSTNYIGAYNGSGEFFNGKIDEIRFWNTARTLTQINSNKYCEIIAQTNLQALYHFNDGEPNVTNTGVDTLVDVSGNNNIGTLIGFALTGSTSNWSDPSIGHEIEVRGNSIIINDGDITPALTDHTDFGTGIFTRTFTIKNISVASVKIDSIRISGANAADFSITTSPSSTIAAGVNSTFVVTFIPSALGLRNATITIYNNDCDESEYNFNISGTGVTAKILDFDGTNDYVSIPHNSNQVGMSNLTLEAWVKPSADSTFRNIMIKGNYGYGLIIDNNNQLGYWSNSTYSSCPKFGTVPTNTWSHVAVVVVQGVSATFYINGVNVGSSTTSGHTTINSGSNDSLYLGYQGSGCACNYFKGTMEEVRTWNVARTQADIQSNMFCQSTTQSNLTHLYNFNQGIASGLNTGVNTLTDSSGNSYNGSLKNFALTADASNWKLESAIGLEINLQGLTIDIVNNDTTPSLTDNTDFGTIGTGAVRTYTIQNTGSTALNISSIYLTGVDSALFTLGAITPASPIPALSSATFTVTFTGVTSGIKKATVNIISNDCDEGKYSFAIKAEAQLGSALAFDGSNDRITTQLTISGSYTREAWIYPTNFNNYQTQIISADANIGCGASFGTNAFGYLSAGHPCASSWSNVQDGTQLPLNTWTHAAVTYDATTQEMKLYKNGNLVSSSTGVGSYGTETVSIGGWGNSYLWNGRIDEARVWNKVLLECQIQQNMNGELNGLQDGLVLNYHFNQGLYNQNNAGEDTAYDASGNGKNGYLENFDLTDTFSNWIAPGGVITGTMVDTLPVEIDIKGNGVSIANSDMTPSTADQTDWDTVAINQASVKTFTIYNLGTDTLEINNINTSGADSADFVVQTLTYPVKIAGGQNITFTITLTPSSYLNKTALVTLNNNDCDEAIYKFNIKGFCQLLAPSPVVATPTTICLGDSSKLVATIPLANIKWYNSPTGGTEIGETMSDSGFFVSPTIKDTFYAESFAIVSGTKEYNIGLSELTGMSDICGGGIGVYTGYNGYTGSGNVGFTWNDATIATITSATVELSAGIICSYNTFNTSLNSQSQPSISVNSNCTCTPSTSVNGITSVVLNVADYNLGGANQFTVNVPGAWFGLMPNSSIGNNYAKVIVTYLDTLRSATRTPIVVNVGCECKFTSTIPSAPGTYTSAIKQNDGSYSCFCDSAYNLLLAIDTIGTNAVISATGVKLQIGNTKTTTWNDAGGIIANPNGGVIFNRKWDVTPVTQPSSPVKVKFFFTQTEYDSVRVKLSTMGTNITSPTQFEMYKLFSNGFGDPHASSASGIVLLNGSNPSTTEWLYSSIGSDHCAEFLVSSFSGGGGGAGAFAMPLPVDFISFTAQGISNTSALLKWQTAQETGNSHFEVERSLDGVNFIKIGTVNANRTNAGNYQYLDQLITIGTPKAFYRIKQIDNDGMSKTTNIQLVNFGQNIEPIIVYPNPFSTNLNVNIETLNPTETAEIEIIDALGKVVLKQTTEQMLNQLDLSNLSNGIYQLIIKTNNEIQHFKVMKQ